MGLVDYDDGRERDKGSTSVHEGVTIIVQHETRPRKELRREMLRGLRDGEGGRIKWIVSSHRVEQLESKF